MKNIILLIASLVLMGCSNPDRSGALIVIDAGHGGKDSGAVCNGKYEKDIVLQIAKKLKDELKHEGYRVYLTRSSDRFLTLGQRTRIADKKDAKIFISIHANAILKKSRFEQTRGVETYFLQKSRDTRSKRIAAKENAAVLQGQDKLSQSVILDSILNGPKIIESNKLAIDVQNNIIKSLNRRYSDVYNGGVRPAPFYVLVGASRPSILIEVGYITNTKERQRLFDSSYQQQIAKGIVSGVNRYLYNHKKQLGF